MISEDQWRKRELNDRIEMLFHELVAQRADLIELQDRLREIAGRLASQGG